MLFDSTPGHSGDHTDFVILCHLYVLGHLNVWGIPVCKEARRTSIERYCTLVCGENGIRRQKTFRLWEIVISSRGNSG